MVAVGASWYHGFMNASKPSAIVALLAMAILAGCRGKVVSTAELHGAGTAEAHFTSTGAPLVLWADTDGKWSGGKVFPAHYEIDVLSGTSTLGHVACDTKDENVSVCGTKIELNATISADCELKLECQLPTIPSGDATLRVTGTPGKNVIETRRMSINVRAK